MSDEIKDKNGLEEEISPNLENSSADQNRMLLKMPMRRFTNIPTISR